MPRLLVSVRNAAEAMLALAAGVDLIDVKEPARGPLGSADVEVVAEIAAVIGGQRPLSVALGEWHAPPSQHAAVLGRDVAYVKLGLAGAASERHWRSCWRDRMAAWPSDVGRVAVVYADAQQAGAPRVDDVLEWAAETECAAVLVDTFDKSAGSLVDAWSHEEIARFIGRVQSSGKLCVLAGGLSLAAIERLLPLGADYIAVRGAACRAGQRGGTLDPARLDRLVALVHHATPHAARA